MEEKTGYRAGIYVRLSREDQGRHDWQAESNSIRSQRELCGGFVREQGDMEVYDTYVDEGFSGADFDRPEFRRMMADIWAGKVNCVVVKDLSRLGRDYIEAGRLIQRIFPALCVRFIAVTDRFDSLTADYRETSLVVPVKNFVNDAYCLDISQKVRSQQRIRRERGEFIGAFPVYGYRRDPSQRGRLTPEPYGAMVVRDIFAWRREGMSALGIARRLDLRGILCPLEYRRCRGENFATGFAVHPFSRWSGAAVGRILSDETYTGTLVQGKSCKLSHRTKIRRMRPREEWVRAEHTHEAIVSPEEFRSVQELGRCRARPGGDCGIDLFAGLLYCRDCGGTMVRRSCRREGAERVSYICGTANRGGGCGRHTIRREELERQVEESLKLRERKEEGEKSEGEGLGGCEREPGAVLGRYGSRGGRILGEDRTALLEAELERVRREAARYPFLRSCVREDVKGGALSGEEGEALEEIYRERQRGLEKALRRQEQALIKERTVPAEVCESRLNRARLGAVERIWVCEGGRIQVELSGQRDGEGCEARGRLKGGWPGG